MRYQQHLAPKWLFASRHYLFIKGETKAIAPMRHIKKRFARYPKSAKNSAQNRGAKLFIINLIGMQSWDPCTDKVLDVKVGNVGNVLF